MTVSEDSIRNAFSLVDKRLKGDSNVEIMRAIANDARRASYEGSLNRIVHSALSDVIEDCYVYSAGQPRELHNIDICVVQSNDVVVAIESKGTVANSHSSDYHTSAIDLHGIRTKLWQDKRSPNSIQNDIKDISQKIPKSESCPRFEVFVPIIYELYREGGSPSVWFSERKPWVTLPKFRNLGVRLKDDLESWFYSQDPRFMLLHASESVELRGANEYWLKTSKAKFPLYNSLEAYVSFYAFARFVESS